MIRPGCAGLFRGFFAVGIRGFGGVLPWARRMLVEEHRWLSEREFVEVLSLGQVLPGPNIVNLAVVVGRRFAGPRGALCAFAGLMTAPLCIVLLLAELYRRGGDIALVHHALAGIAAAAAGLVLGTGARMALHMERRAWVIALALLTFGGVALLRLPLLGVLGVLAPLGIVCAVRDMWAERRA
ncbi:chromate transporter [Niveibacterium sp. SC-1]|uniref:chromate transporter n=1 Tax=Niveibacterium sp. SC-1 TaxID=3135646 RepID=UPI00311D70AF